MYFSSTSIIYSPKYDKLFFSTANSGRIKRIFSSGAAHTFLWSAAGALRLTAAAMPSLEVLQGHCASLPQPCRSHAQPWSAAGRSTPRLSACAVCRRKDIEPFVSKLPTALCPFSGAWLMYRKKYTFTP